MRKIFVRDKKPPNHHRTSADVINDRYQAAIDRIRDSAKTITEISCDINADEDDNPKPKGKNGSVAKANIFKATETANG